MKTRVTVYGSLAACVVIAAGTPVALAQNSSSRTRVAEMVRKQEESKRASAPAARPSPAPKASSPPPSRGTPSREQARPAPTQRENLYERARQANSPPKSQPARPAPSAPSPRAEERRVEPSASTRGTPSTPRTSTNQVATQRQRLIEAASKQRSLGVEPSTPKVTPSSISGTGGSVAAGARRSGSSGTATPPAQPRNVGRPVYGIALDRANREANPSTPSNIGTGSSSPVVRGLPRAPDTGVSNARPHEDIVERALRTRNDRVGSGSVVPAAPFTGATPDDRSTLRFDDDDDREGRGRGDWNGGRDDDRNGRHDWGGRDRDRHDWDGRDRDRRDWNRRDWDCDEWGRPRARWWDDDCDDWGRSGWSFGLSIGSHGWGLSASYGWSSRYCAPTYAWWDSHWDWRRDWCDPVVVRYSWKRPVYHTTCCWEAGYSWGHASTCHTRLVTAYVPVYYPTSTLVVSSGLGTVQTFTNDGYAGITAASVPAILPALTVAPSPVTVTYRATESSGVLDWADTPGRIIGSLMDAPESARGSLAGQYLGRSVAGAWELVVDRVQASGSRTMIVTTPRGAGDRTPPVVALMVDAAPAGLREGSIILASGRVVEVTLHDPDAAGGVMVLDEVKIAR